MSEYQYLLKFEDEWKAKDEKFVSFDEKWISDKINDNFITYAEKLGEYLVKPNDDNKNALTTSQIRNIYGEVKRIQLGGFSNMETSFLLLKPKLSYNIKRNTEKGKGLGLNVFGDVFFKAFDIVIKNQDPTKRSKCFENFCQVMEAIVAFHRGKGGK